MNQHLPTGRLGDHVEILSGFAFKSERFNTDGDGLPLVRIRDVTRGYSDTFYDGPFDEQFVVSDGDLLVGMDGEFNRERWSGGRALLNQRVCRLLPKPGILDRNYLFHLLPSVLKKIEDATPFVTVKHLSVNELRAVQLALPPLGEQRRIAGILDKADALRQKRKRAIALLDSLTQSIFLEMFGDGTGSLPQVQLQALCLDADDIRCGPFGTQLNRAEFTDHGVPLWGIKQVNTAFTVATHEYVSLKKAQALANYDIRPGDLVMTRKGTIGNCAVYPADFDVGIMHSDLLRIRLNHEACDPVFMNFQLHLSQFVEHQIYLISGGAIMAGINVGKLKKLFVQLPPLTEQRLFSERVARIEALRNAAADGLAGFEDLFTSLQHRAFSGQL